MANALGGLLQRFQQQEESARAANVQRYEQAMQIYDEIISRYRPGGEFGAAALGQLEQRKVRDVGKETQQLISSGLYGTTTMGATGRRWEETVGGPERLKLEDIQMQRLSQAQVGKAGFIERREDVGPDPGLIAQLAMQAGQASTAYRKPRIPDPGDYESISAISSWKGMGGPSRRTPPQTSAEYYATRRVQDGGGAGAGVDIEMGEQLPKTMPTGYKRTPTGVEPTAEPYIQGKNYAYMLRQKTGETLSQRAAYAKLQQLK